MFPSTTSLAPTSSAALTVPSIIGKKSVGHLLYAAIAHMKIASAPLLILANCAASVASAETVRTSPASRKPAFLLVRTTPCPSSIRRRAVSRPTGPAPTITYVPIWRSSFATRQQMGSLAPEPLKIEHDLPNIDHVPLRLGSLEQCVRHLLRHRRELV